MTDVVFIADYEPDVVAPAPIVSSITEYSPGANDLAICAVGSPVGRRAVAELLASKGARFATFVHDNAVVGERVTLAEGVIICPGAILSVDIKVARHVHINLNCSIGHDVRIAEFCTISPASNLMGDVHLGQDVFLGTAATLAPHVTIGDGTTIGAGSVVVKNVESRVTAFGNPCRVVSRHSQ